MNPSPLELQLPRVLIRSAEPANIMMLFSRLIDQMIVIIRLGRTIRQDGRITKQQKRITIMSHSPCSQKEYLSL